MGKVLNFIGQGLQAGLEARDTAATRIVETGKELKGKITAVAYEGREAISGRGPGFIAHCRRFGSDVADVPLDSCKHLLQAGVEAVTLHPFKAMREATKIGTSAIKNSAKALASSSVVGISGARESCEKAYSVISAPVKGVKTGAVAIKNMPIKAFHSVSNGLRNTQKWLTEATTKTAPTAEDKPAKMSDTPPAGSAKKVSNAERLTGIPDTPHTPPVANDNAEGEAKKSVSPADTASPGVKPIAVEPANDTMAKAA